MKKYSVQNKKQNQILAATIEKKEIFTLPENSLWFL